MSFEDALAVLRSTFGEYMEDNVMSKVTINKMGNNFTHFEN